MATSDPSYPGVYVNESASLSLSISASETAVPVIFTEADIKLKNPERTGSLLFRVESWADAQNLLKDYESYDKFETKDGPAAANTKISLLYAVLRSYFDNGGGHCYVGQISNDAKLRSALSADIQGQHDITLLVQSGVPDPSFNSVAGDLKEYFTILDAPQSYQELATYTNAKSAYKAAYFPWLIAPAYFILPPENRPVPYPLPPSGAIAGIYCKTDRTRGVWKTPANVALAGGLVPAVNVSDSQQGKYNDLHASAINMIRKFRNGDTLVWGGRTGDITSDWRYIAVRRLFKAAETDIKAAMQQVVFEPNAPATWEIVRAAIDNYLHKLWQQGGLFGDKPEDAYFVRVGKGITMSDSDIKDGKMVVRVGIAAVRPAEFIILEFSQMTASAA